MSVATRPEASDDVLDRLFRHLLTFGGEVPAAGRHSLEKARKTYTPKRSTQGLATFRDHFLVRRGLSFHGVRQRSTQVTGLSTHT